jgi:hypothetical protein
MGRSEGSDACVRGLVGAAHSRLLRVRGNLGGGSVAAEVKNQPFAEPFRNRRVRVSFDDHVEQFVQQDTFEHATRPQQIGRLQPHSAAARAGGDPTGLAGRVAEAGHARINADARPFFVTQSGTPLGFSQQAVGKRDNIPSLRIIQSLHLHPLA